MSTLSVNEPIELTDGTYQFVEQSGSVIRLRAADGNYRDMHIAALSQNVVGLPKSFSPSIRFFEQLPAKQRKRATTMADHIQEILTGINPNRAESPRLEYDLETTTQNKRIEAKVNELNAKGQRASRAKLMRDIKAYREGGASALIDHRTLPKAGPLDNIHPDIKDALCWVIEDQVKRSTGTKQRLINETGVLLRTRFGSEAPALPSTATMYRYIDLLTVGKHTTGSAKTRQSLANRPTPPYAKRVDLLPGSELQVDSTTLDVLVRTPLGLYTRPILTVLMDRATRVVVAFTLRLTATKAVDHVALLGQALTPPQNRPDKTAFREAVQRANPQITLLSQDERTKYEETRPYIHPRTIVMDNGKDYISDAFIAALEKHHIDVRFSAPHTPTSKPLVERNFGSINTLFVQHLAGYTGRSPEFRGYKVEEEDGVIDIFALHELFDDWLLKVWNHRPHSGLRDKMHPEVVLSPYQMFLASKQVSSHLEVTLTRDDYIDMLPTIYRVIGATGVQDKYRTYDSIDLNPLRNTKSNLTKKKGKHEVKVDPYNPFYAWVRNPAGGWIECQLRDMEVMLHPAFDSTSVIEPAELGDRETVAVIGAAISGSPLHRELVQKPTTNFDTPTHPDDTDTVYVIDGNE
ncbi:hypothetical protein [Leifsonia sp. NPDC058248]|uniref:hypothetical protein n=1 Tax=Leifsonia sp. NPDC058248 TaxID=3346402 RepID=UPI0036DA2D60